MFHVKRSNNEREAKTHRSAKVLLEKRVFVRKYSRRKTMFIRPIVMSEIAREVREDKDSSKKKVLERGQGPCTVDMNRCKQTYYFKGN